MANYSIPNSTPAIGRTSTPLLRRSRKQNDASASFFEAFSLANVIASRTFRFFNAQHSTLNTQRSIQTVGRWMLGVERWAFSFWRVKGAWWSSRSSKPLSVPHTRDRGRFDSYPLRHFIFDFRMPIFDLILGDGDIFPIENRQLAIENFERR
jgi:hypothetical protein